MLDVATDDMGNPSLVLPPLQCRWNGRLGKGPLMAGVKAIWFENMIAAV